MRKVCTVRPAGEKQPTHFTLLVEKISISRQSLQCLSDQEIHNITDVNSSDQAIQKNTDVNSSDQTIHKNTDVNSSDQETQNNNDAAFNNNSHIKYENCVFHGNIIYNFHCSCTDYTKSEKKIINE